jgi:hypothetical protein
MLRLSSISIISLATLNEKYRFNKKSKNQSFLNIEKPNAYKLGLIDINYLKNMLFKGLLLKLFAINYIMM